MTLIAMNGRIANHAKSLLWVGTGRQRGLGRPGAWLQDSRRWCIVVPFRSTAHLVGQCVESRCKRQREREREEVRESVSASPAADAYSDSG